MIYSPSPTATISRKVTQRMPEDHGGDITRHLLAWRQGDGEAMEQRDASCARAWLKRALTTEAGP